MSTHIDLDPQTTDQLMALAEERGVTAEEVIKYLVEQLFLSTHATPKSDSEEFEADMQAFAEGTENLESTYTGNYSREDIYFDHD